MRIADMTLQRQLAGPAGCLHGTHDGSARAQKTLACPHPSAAAAGSPLARLQAPRSMRCLFLPGRRLSTCLLSSCVMSTTGEARWPRAVAGVLPPLLHLLPARACERALDAGPPLTRRAACCRCAACREGTYLEEDVAARGLDAIPPGAFP